MPRGYPYITCRKDRVLFEKYRVFAYLIIGNYLIKLYISA